MSDVTVGSSAPGTGDVEFRFNVTDTDGKNMNDLDLVRIIEGVQDLDFDRRRARWRIPNNRHYTATKRPAELRILNIVSVMRLLRGAFVVQSAYYKALLPLIAGEDFIAPALRAWRPKGRRSLVAA